MLIFYSPEQEPRTRPDRHSRSHSLFLRSVETFPTPSGYYHLSLSFARTGQLQDLDQAITNLESALESEPGEIRYWHALGLFLAAIEQWKAAIGALEQGSGIGEGDLADETIENTADHGSSPTDREKGEVQVQALTLSVPNCDTLEKDGGKLDQVRVLLDLNAEAIAPSESLLRPLLDHPPPSRQELFEHALQLRMTQVAVAELVEGPEGAVDRWVEVFSWIAEKRGVGVEQRQFGNIISYLDAF